MALYLSCALPAGSALAASAASGTGDEVTALRQELEQTKALVRKLESRLEVVEAQAAAAEAQDQQTVAVAEAGGAAGGSSPSAFNPAISVVLQGSYNAYSRNPEDLVLAGFAPPEGAGLPNEGFSLGESELNLSANIDPMFYGSLTVSLEDDGGSTDLNVEEAFIETLALPWGTKVKAGRMYPVLGYLNEIHPHADAFVDRPLPYKAFFGGDNYGDDGVQVSVLLPTALFAEIGGGVFRGIGYPAAGSANDGNGSQSLFARVGGDIGASQSWLAGISYLHAEASDRDTDGLVFTGKTPVYIADGKYTWAPEGNMANRFLVLQGEYFRSRADGTWNDLPYDETSDGWYVQAVYKFASQWKAGYRFAYLGAPGVPLDLVGTALDSEGHNPRSQSWLLERDFSEFSSLRLQYNRDDSDSRGNDEAVLRYTISMGAHGAHKY
jgi:hypothetical protein